jgi:lipid-A-disaccharide synthase
VITTETTVSPEPSAPSQHPPRVFVVAGEHSGDALGGRLMAAIRRRLGDHVTFAGVGGEHMEAEGLRSIFPLSEVAVMGPLAILRRLPAIVRRVYETVDAAIAADPDVVVIIDSPEFTHPIAKRIRKRRPDIPIIDYVSPSVWAWRPGRARKMRAYVDHVLALLPFEPEAHQRLGGPSCTYVGHPLIEKLNFIAGRDPGPLMERLGILHDRPVLAVLPGSRSSEVERLLDVFGETVRTLDNEGLRPHVVIPTVESVRALVEAKVRDWPEPPVLVFGEDDRFSAFRLADAALAASGTVTLELALAGTPMVVAYRVDRVASLLRYVIKVPSIVLANLVLGANAVPEFVQENCTARNLAGALSPLLADTEERARQVAALADVSRKMALPHGVPSDAAADVVLRYAEAHSRAREFLTRAR